MNPQMDTPSFFGNWLPLLMLLSFAGCYLYGVYLLRRKDRTWKASRILFFMSGTVLLLMAFSPPLTVYAHHSLQGHMIQHLLIGMLAPLGLVLGAPLTLALQVWPSSRGRRLSAFLSCRPIHFLGHPVTALLLNIGGMYLLYLTPLFAMMKQELWLHYVVHFHFLAAGYLFTWSVAGPDPAPNRPNFRLRLLVLFISMATHAYLSKLMYVYSFPRFTSFNKEAIQEAALWMYYGGDLAEVLLAIVFFTYWYRRRLGASVIIPLKEPL